MFEFTKEQREAWRLIVTLMEQNTNLCHLNWTQCAECMLRAASRFDAREKTCGIEPLSEEHFLLGVCNSRYAYFENIKATSLIRRFEKERLVKWNESKFWDTTDRGREVLAALNAMCKVQA